MSDLLNTSSNGDNSPLVSSSSESKRRERDPSWPSDPSLKPSLSRGTRFLTWAAILILLGELICFGVSMARNGQAANGMRLGNIANDKGQTGLAMVYYRGPKFDRPLQIQIARGPLKYFFTGESIPYGIPGWDLSVRFSGQLKVPRPGEYIFYVHCDDAARLYVDRKKIFNSWPRGTMAGAPTPKVALPEGRIPFLLEMNNTSHSGLVAVEWSGPQITRRFLHDSDFLIDPNPGLEAP